MTKAQKWAARAAGLSAGTAMTAPAAASSAPRAAAPTATRATAGGLAATVAPAQQGSTGEVALLKKALEDMRKQMLLHQQFHQQERADLSARLEQATKAAKEKEEAEQSAAQGSRLPLVATLASLATGAHLGGLENLENAVGVARKGVGWMSQQARQMARVETPEDMMHRKKFEEQQKVQEEARESQDSVRESALSKSGRTAAAHMTGAAKVLEDSAPMGKRFVSSGGHSIDDKADEGPRELNGWARINFNNGDYEGYFVDGKPNGFGRMYWGELRMAYHGEMRNQQMSGKGTFFYPNGDMLEGSFEEHNPKGTGVLTELKTGKRFNVEYDGSKKLLEGAVPAKKLLVEEPLQLMLDHCVAVTACSRGDKHQPFAGNYSHCKKAIDAKLAYCVPLRAHRPLENANQIAGRVAVVQRGSCSFGKKLRYVQAAGAVAMLVLGTDNLEKHQQVFQIHEGDPLADDPWPEGQVPPPIKVEIPVCYSLGIHEQTLPHGAYVRLRFYENSPGVIKGWLMGCVFVNKQSIHPELDKEEANNLLQEFLSARQNERKEEKKGLERRLKGEESKRSGEYSPTHGDRRS